LIEIGSRFEMSAQFYEFERPEEDPRTTVELFRNALVLTADDDAYWECVRALHWRGTREVFDAAARLAFSADSPERKLGIVAIAQLGVPDRTFPEEGERIVLGVFALESDPEILAEIGFALGWTGGDESSAALVALSRHSDPDVRYAAVHGLGSQEGDEARLRLIELTQDPFPVIRDWATFSLAISDVDTPELREVLLWRTRDEDEDVRGEALRGLASRKDFRVFEPLSIELAGKASSLALEAAAELADPRLYPALQQLAARCDHEPDELARALDACRPR
jgi:HEAT repeat protein